MDEIRNQEELIETAETLTEELAEGCKHLKTGTKLIVTGLAGAAVTGAVLLSKPVKKKLKKVFPVLDGEARAVKKVEKYGYTVTKNENDGTFEQDSEC